MTIPRIGNKIVRVKKQVSQNTPVPSVAPEVSSSVEVPDYEDASLDDLSDENQNDITDSGNVPAQEKMSVPAVEYKNPENNYSIEKFTQDYSDNLHDEVLPILAQYEPERKQKLVLAVLLGGLFLSIGIFLPFFVGADWKAVVLMLGIAVLCGFFIKNSYEKKIKTTVMQLLINALPNFDWHLESPIPEDDITECIIFPNAKKADKSFSNAFTGKYRDVDFSVVECKYTYNKNNLFSGAVIRIKMNKDFEGVTVIRPKKFVPVKDMNDLKKARMLKLETENMEFNKLYNVYSTNHTGARYLLTTSFIEYFNNIYTAFASKVAYCSFYGKYVYIAPYCTGDIFSVCSLFKDVADEQQYAKLFEELKSILALIDYLKPNKKL